MKNIDLSIARLSNSVTRLKASLWPNDKYPELPQLLPKATVVLLNVDGPGVITHMHTTRFSPKIKGENWNWDGKYIRDVRLRVYYDFNKTPAIDMPFFDFFSDIDGESNYFSTTYFSKVKRANNSRLIMPFKEHIKIEVENPTDIKLSGYIDIQWEKLNKIPDDTGYLYTDYRQGTVKIPEGNIELCQISKKGSIIANWLQLSCDDILCSEGAVLCEGNDEFYLDNESSPSIEYLGTEDFFGFSWGFSELQCDGHIAILQKKELQNGGVTISMLRTRENDKINFSKSCRLLLEYRHEINNQLPNLNPEIKKALEQGNIIASVKSCVYYYAYKK